jgi:hypothetical protein
MAIYHFAIDETGSFGLDKEDKSFVCGILISKDEKILRERYKDAFKKCGFGDTAANDTAGLLDGEKFHFSGMSKEHKAVCREVLLPLVDKVFVSAGKPLLRANNQDFWLRAAVSVIQKLFVEHTFQKGDRLNIVIDHRADRVWGLSDKKMDFNEYHNMIKRQIDSFIEPYRTKFGMEVLSKFIGDTRSFFVNLADIVCGFARTEPAIDKIECRCENVVSGDNPSSIMDKNPIGALSVIFTEILVGKSENIKFLSYIIKNAKSENYIRIWDLFYNFLQYCVDNRYGSQNTNSEIKEAVDIFCGNFKNNSGKIPVDKRLEIIKPLMAYYSHRGEIGAPVTRDDFIKLLSESTGKIDGRVTRKWERYVSFRLREAQFQYNAYNFTDTVTEWEEIWAKQEKIIKVGFPFDAQKDEHTAAIISTLAQSYAYNNRIEKAITLLELSADYTIKTSAQTYSYLLTLYFIKQDIENARKYFELQTGKKTEDFIISKDGNVWNLLSYSKIRALELNKNKRTDLPEITITDNDRKRPYPWPLVLKWSATAKYFENPTENKPVVSDYLSNAVRNLLDDGFTMKTLALPLIQMYALVDNSNQYHAKYPFLITDLKKQSPHFADFVENRAPLLNQIKNDADIWERATALPFNYS